MLPQEQGFPWELLYQAPRTARLCHVVFYNPRTGLQPIGAGWPLTYWRRLVASSGYGFVAADTPEASLPLLTEYRGKGAATALLEGLNHTASAIYPAIS